MEWARPKKCGVKNKSLFRAKCKWVVGINHFVNGVSRIVQIFFLTSLPRNCCFALSTPITATGGNSNLARGHGLFWGRVKFISNQRPVTS